MFCRFCGKLIPDDSQYCEFCGKKINGSIDEEISADIKKAETIENYAEESMAEEPEQIDDYQACLETDDMMYEDTNFLSKKNELESSTDGRNNSPLLQEQFDCIDTVGLKEYLDIVVNMEKSIYLQNKLITQMQNRYAQLGQAYTYHEPVAPKDVTGEDFVMGGVSVFIGFLLFLWGLYLGNASFGKFLFGLIVLCLGGGSFTGRGNHICGGYKG